MAWTPPLSLEQAITICGAIAERAFHAEGLWDPDKPMTSLEGITLGQMVEAAALVERANAQPAQEGRSKTVHVVPDHRLIAGVYALEHYAGGQVCIASKSSETDGHRWMVVVLHRPNPGEKT